MKPNLVIQGHFLHHPFSGQGVFLEEMLRCWAKNSDIELLLWYRDNMQKQQMEERTRELGVERVRWCRLPSWLPFRLTLGFWECIWVPWQLQKVAPVHHFFSPSLVPLLWHPGGKTKSIQMVLHDTFLLTDPVYTKGWTRRFYNMLLRRTLRHKRVTLWTVSEASRQAIVPLAAGKMVRVAGNGIDHLQTTTAAPWDTVAAAYKLQKPYILYQGGYDARKNVPALVTVFRDLRKTRPNLQLVLCGNSLHASSLYDNLAMMATEPGVVHTGFVDRPVLRSLFANAAICASPSRAEGFNIVIGEALMEGATVIASRIPVHEELWGKHALLTDFADIPATTSLFEGVLAGQKSPPLSPAERTGLSWATQAGKIHAFFV